MINHVYNQESLDDLMHNTDNPVVIDFWAEWCAPCKIIAPSVDALEEVATVIKVNVDEAQELAEAYDVRSIPTVLVYYEDGEPAHTVVGADLTAINEIAKELVTHHRTRDTEVRDENTTEEEVETGAGENNAK